MATTKVRAELVDLNESTSESGLKMPSGTEFNRPTEVLGQIRNNTNESISGSSSAMEYYNNTAWQKIGEPIPTMDFMIVSGGGQGGGGFYGGGGGAGGLRTSYGSTSGGGLLRFFVFLHELS